MAMVSMKVEREDKMAEVKDNPYGYGLTICLNEEQVEALGLNKNPPEAGSSVGIQAMATVRRVTRSVDAEEDMAEGEPADGVDTVLELQITDMGVTTPGRQSADTAGKLYGGENG